MCTTDEELVWAVDDDELGRMLEVEVTLEWAADDVEELVCAAADEDELERTFGAEELARTEDEELGWMLDEDVCTTDEELMWAVDDDELGRMLDAEELVRTDDDVA